MLLTNFKNKPDSTHATSKIKARLLPRCKPEGLLLTRRSVDATPSGGLTIGGLREFTIPNQQIPHGSIIFKINF